jgi:hypothetical protein
LLTEVARLRSSHFATRAETDLCQFRECEPITLNGTTQANFSAPTSSPLAGILFFQDPSASSGSGSIINGNSSSTFDGALYFPTTQLTYNGNSSASCYTIIVAGQAVD